MSRYLQRMGPTNRTAVRAVIRLIPVLMALTACQGSGAVPPTATAVRPSATGESTRITEVVVAAPTEMPEVMVTAPLPGEKEIETEHFALYVEDGTRPVDLEALAQKAERIYLDISGRMGADAPGPIILAVQKPQETACRPRGFAFVDETGSRVTIFADEQTPQAQIDGVLAHELAHVIHAAGFEQTLTGDRNLTEGLATWIAREYWVAWLGTESVDQMVRDYLAAGEYVRLADADVFDAYPRDETASQENCLALRERLYTEWASFIGTLVDRYGWESFVALMASAEPETSAEGEVFPVPADYEGVYGKTLQALEAEWLARIEG